jgi:hypothetical protein
MAMTGPQLRVLVAGHARVEAAATARAMSAVRTAVWAEMQDFTAAIEALESGDGSDDGPGDWLMGFDSADWAGDVGAGDDGAGDDGRHGEVDGA